MFPLNQDMQNPSSLNLGKPNISSDPQSAGLESSNQIGSSQNIGHTIQQNPGGSSMNPTGRDGISPGKHLEQRGADLSTPTRTQKFTQQNQMVPDQLTKSAKKIRANAGSSDNNRNMQRALQMTGDARLSLKSDNLNEGGLQSQMEPKDTINNPSNPLLATQQMRSMENQAPPTYRSMGEDDDMMPLGGVNMPQMNPNKVNKDPKFNGLNDTTKLQNFNQMQGPNMTAKMNFEQVKETSQIFGINKSNKKQNVMPPASALLDDGYDENLALEMGRMSSEEPKSKQKNQPLDFNLGASVIGSAHDEKQKLISSDNTPISKQPQSKSKLQTDQNQFQQFQMDSNVQRASIIKNKLNPRSMVPQTGQFDNNDDNEDFAYEFIGRGQDTIVSSDIKKYTPSSNKDFQNGRGGPYSTMNQKMNNQHELIKNEAHMNPINDSLHFVEPRDRESIDEHVFDFYSKNTYVRYVDADEDPISVDQKILEQKHPKEIDLNITTIKDVRNIHISSDHQRAYVWVITTQKQVGSQIVNENPPRELWLQVYSLSANWSSPSTLSQDQSQKMQMLNQIRIEVDAIQRQLDITVRDKGKKEASKIKEILKQKKQLLQFYEMEIFKEMELFDPSQKPDIDQESQFFHLIDHYKSANKDDQSLTDRGENIKAAKYFQQPQKAEFSIHIGTFEEPKIDYLSDPIQSFYKQFVSSEEAIYFFKFETKQDKQLQDCMAPQSSISSFGGSQPQNAPYSAAISATSGKTGIDSLDDGFSSPTPGQTGYDNAPVLYKLSPYEIKAERVYVNGRTIKLPFDSQTNQFAIVRAMDPQISRELSSIDNLMFAILKEVHIKQEELTEDNTSSQINRRMSSKNKRNQLPPKIIESRIEIYKANQTVTTFGCNIDLKEVPAKLDPKNLSIAHRIDPNDDESYKPVKQDLNFCCWYLIDQQQQSLNVAILINEQIINMRTPFEYDSDQVSIEEFNKRLVVAKNQRLKIDEIDEVPFLQDYKISQTMPIYAIDLKEPTNFAKVPCFLKAANDAKKVWDKELLQKEQDLSKKFPPDKMLSPLQPQHQLQNLYEFQEQVFLNFDVPIERMYIILRQRPNDIDFEVLYPIIPDYLWASQEGQKLREEIDQIILNTYKKYLPEEPNQKSYKVEGVNKMLYSEQYNQAFQNKGDHEKCKQYSRESISLYHTNRLPPRKKWVQDQIKQCVSFHQIFLKKLSELNDGKETNVAMSQMSPHIFAEQTLHQYGLSHFQCTWESIKSIVNQKSLIIAKRAQQSANADDVVEQYETPGPITTRKFKSKNKKTLRGSSIDQRIDEITQEIKSPRSSKSDCVMSPRALSKPKTILVSGGLVEPKDNPSLRVSFQLEKMCICEGLRNFIHIIKYKKKHYVKRNKLGEVIKILYKNNYYAFEEDFEFFDYEIVIGQLDISLKQHCINLNEERDAMKRTQQILAQYEHYDGIFTPLQNPYTPYQQLVMMYDVDPSKEEQRLQSNQNGQLVQKDPIQIMQICQRQSTSIFHDQDNEDLCQMKNLPSEFSFQEFLHNDMFRKEYFEAQLLQVSQVRRVFWQRQKEDTYPLIDYINEQSLAKIWVNSKSSDYNQLYNVRTIDILEYIARDKNAKFTPRTQVILDSRVEPQPQNYAILRNLLIDDFTVVTVKQLKNNPKNVVFAIRPKREMNLPQEINQNGTISEKQMCIHMVGQLDNSMTSLKQLFVIRQQSMQAHAQRLYNNRDKPLAQSTNVLEIQNFNVFAYEFAESNSKLSFMNPHYGKMFDSAYKNCRMTAFDPNFGESMDPNVEIFAMKMWSPLNSVKIFIFNFEIMQIQEIYEIPVDSKHLDQLQNIQIVRISDIKKSFALLLDWCSIKEIYMIEFTSSPVKVKRGHPSFNKYSGSLIGKYDFICPNLTEASYFSEEEKIIVPNFQIKLVPLYKNFDLMSERTSNFVEAQQTLTRDGFSLIYDQGRVDFDYLYFHSLVGNNKVQLHLQYASSVFEYEYRISEKIKRNLNKEADVDHKFFQALINKVRIRSEVLNTNIYSENDKFKLLSYFTKVMQSHRAQDYSQINEKISRIGIRVDIFRNQDFDFFLHPRPEFFGAHFLTFLNDDLELVDRVHERWFEGQKQHNQQMVTLFNNSIVIPFLPSIQGNKLLWQKHQYDFFYIKPRLCELDMNLMSPISWTLFHKCNNTAKIYCDYFKKFAKIKSKEVIADHSVIFYASIKQLLQLGTIDLSEFMDPDGVGEDIGCELFQQTLTFSYLPQFELSDKTFTNEYRRNILTLERNMQQALMIDEIQSPKKAFKEDDEFQENTTTYEVQYGLIDLQWVNILNIFDQNPINRCHKIQKSLQKNGSKKWMKKRKQYNPNLEISTGSGNGIPAKKHIGNKFCEFDWVHEIKHHQTMRTPLISHINFDSCKQVYKFQSIKLLINHYWYHQALDFFKTQFFIYLIFFIFPFIVDLYYLMMVTIPQGDLMTVQILFSVIAFMCQFMFFLSEVIQMLAAGKSLYEYFSEFWNINDFFCLPIYLAALIATWNYDEQSDDQEQQLIAIKVLYTIVICQTFIKLLFFARIFDSVTFLLILMGQIIYDLQGILIFGLIANIIAGSFYVIYEANLLNNYFYIILMDIMFLSIGISIIGQSYEQVLNDAESFLSQQKASMIVECQQILLRLGYIKTHDIQTSILVRKKKFADDIGERLNQEKWSGLTQSLKMYLQFNLRGQFDEYRDKAETNSEQVNAQLAQITQHLAEVKKSLGDKNRSSRKYYGDIDMAVMSNQDNIDISKSKITYEPSLNNISH